MRAFRGGEEYAISDLEENAYNEVMVQEQQNWTPEQVSTEFDLAREDFKQAVQEIPIDKFPGDLLYPWGDERGSVAQLVEYMAEHEVEHRDEISETLKA